MRGFPSTLCSGAYIRTCGVVDYGLRPVDYLPAMLWIRGKCGGCFRLHAPKAGLSPARYAS